MPTSINLESVLYTCLVLDRTMSSHEIISGTPGVKDTKSHTLCLLLPRTSHTRVTDVKLDIYIPSEKIT